MRPGYFASLSNQVTDNVWESRHVPVERTSSDQFKTVGPLPVGYWERATLGIKNLKGEYIPLFHTRLYKFTQETDTVTFIMGLYS